jgi:hypothetical protein
MESNFDMFNHILEFVQKKEQKMIFHKPSQSLIKSSFETRSREPSQCVPPSAFQPNNESVYSVKRQLILDRSKM